MSATVRDYVAQWRRVATPWDAESKRIREATGFKVWNPGLYGEKWHTRHLETYPPSESPVLLFGLNPGPYGMGQTGIPFTDVRRIKTKLPRLRDALVASGERLELPGLAPPDLQPFLSMTHEASSVRVYLFLEKAFGNAEEGSSRVFVANPCPLLFMDSDGKNRTPADFKRAANATIGREAASRLLTHLQEIRVECALDAARVARPRAAVLLGKEVDAALGEALSSELGKARVIAYPHPARAIPEAWASGLVSQLKKRNQL
ncbi:MAG: hypothetical protein HY556_09685 [Euryarchaeota archaeon]|nr:hypothetical protein [Euryarchaeota archaeon]